MKDDNLKKYSIHHITLKPHPPVLRYGNQVLYFSVATVNAIHGLGHLCIKVSQLSLSTRLEERKEVWLDLWCGLQVEDVIDNQQTVSRYKEYYDEALSENTHVHLQTQDRSMKLTHVTLHGVQ